MRFQAFVKIVALFVLGSAHEPAQAQGFESIWYTPGSGEARLESARQHIDQISIIAPQAYWAAADGTVHGEVSDSLLILSRERGIRVMPLIVNRGFNQESIHELLMNPAARRRCIEGLVQEGIENNYWGWQFDFENIHISDRDSLTVFFKNAASALHQADMILSIAVVPTNGSFGDTRFSRFMQENWRGSFDVGALAEAGDFISLMTYSQHGGAATPGPVSGLRWMEEMLQYALSQGVPLNKISLGLPSYSGYWFSDYREGNGARVVGREISHSRAVSLLDNPAAHTEWLEAHGVLYAFWENSGLFEWLFLEDARSFSEKMKLFDSYPGLRGISVWVLGAEDPDVWKLLEKYSN